jgi:hypothetical protein
MMLQNFDSQQTRRVPVQQSMLNYEVITTAFGNSEDDSQWESALNATSIAQIIPDGER